MKNSIIVLITAFTLGLVGWMSNPKTPTATAENVAVYSQPFEEEIFKAKLDSIEDYKQKELQKYESEIKNSSKTIKKKQEELQEITMSIDSLFGLVSTTDTIVNIDTFKSKKTSWLKKQINKLKYEKSKN